MKFSLLELIKFVNRLYPPSSASIHQPGELSESVVLGQRALPPSLLFDRAALNEVDGAAAAAVVESSAVPANKFWWVHAADLKVMTAGVTAGGFAFIQVTNPNLVDRAVTVAAGALVNTSFIDAQRVLSHAIFAVEAGVSTLVNAGGGQGGFIVPQGHTLKGVTSATMAVTGFLRLQWLFTECTTGEEIPSIG